MTNQTEAYRKPELELVGFDGDVILTSGPLPTCTTEIIECPDDCANDGYEACDVEMPEICIGDNDG